MSATLPITQRDVAQACGLHPSTVCLALKNSPSIPLETRQRIQAIAGQLGYHPNVAARNLALLRTEKKSGGTLPLAWINQEARRDHWRADPHARLFFEGAQRRAEELGYHLEEIWAREPGMNAARIAQIVRARGIAGAILPAQHHFDFALLNAGWSDCALVGVNDYRFGEWIDVVCADYFKNTELALLRLQRHGFARVGLVLSPQFDAASSGLVHSCFLRQRALAADGDRVPVCFAPEQSDVGAATVAEWCREHRPDAVLCHHSIRFLRAAGRRHEPAWIQIHGAVDAFDAAVDVEPSEIGAAAADCVVAKIRRFDFGLREATRCHLLKGSWHEFGLARREAESVVA